MADRSIVVRLTAEVAGYMSSMSAAAKVTKDFGATAVDAAAKHRDSWDRVGKAMLLGGGVVALGVGEAIKAAAEFDHAMSVVQANIDDKSAPSMKRLSDAALAAGRSTMFSATQAAEAENELAKAGISSADIVGGALSASLALASAGQLNLADAAEYTASTMVQFNLHAKDTGHIADVLAAAADKSLGGVSDIAEALKYAGVSAGQFGLSLDSTVGVLAEFASNGLLGSMAGTGLREMLVKLVSPSAAAKDAIKTLGLQFFDSNGKFMGMANVAGQLHDKLANLTQQQREQTLVTLFGQRAMAEGNILYRDGAAGVEKWTNAVNDQGFAALQASTKMNNLQGDLTKFKNTLNAVLIEGGQQGQGPLRTLTQDATGMVSAFGSLPAPLTQAALGIGVVTAGSLLLGGTVIMTTTRIGALKTALQTMGVEGEAAGSALKFAGAAAAGVAVGVPLLHSLSEALTGDKALGNNTAAAQIVSNTGAIGDGFAHLGDTLKSALGDSALDKFRRVGLDWSILPDDATRSVHWLQSMDAGLSQLAQSGPANAQVAATAFKRITDEAKAQGISMATLADAMPQYSASVSHVAQASKDVSVQAAQASAAMVQLGGNADATGSAMALMGKGADAASDDVKNLAKAIQSDMDAASKAFMKDMDVLGNYQPAKADGKVAAAQDALNKALENLQYTRERIGARGQLTVSQQQQLGKAETAVHDSVSKSAKARGKAEQNLSDLQARLAAKGQATPSTNHALEVANDAVAKAQKGLEAAKAADGSLSTIYASAIAKGQRFTQDITAVMQKGLDPQVVSKLLQEGPTLAAPVLQQLLGSNSSSLIKMVNTSEAQIRHLNSIVVEQARLTAMAVRSDSDNMTSDLSAAMGIAQMKALSKTGVNAQDIAKKMHMTPAEATRIATEFGIGLQKSPPPPVPITVNVDGAHRKLDLFERDLQAFANKTWTTYLDLQTGSGAGAPTSSWQQLYGVNPQAGLSNTAMQQLLGGGASSHSVVNNSPINIANVSGPSLDDIRRQAEQQARLRALSREQVP